MTQANFAACTKVALDQKDFSRKPQCDKNGMYSAEQCDKRTKVCWCASSFGQEVPATRLSFGKFRNVSCDIELKSRAFL